MEAVPAGVGDESQSVALTPPRPWSFSPPAAAGNMARYGGERNRGKQSGELV